MRAKPTGGYLWEEVRVSHGVHIPALWRIQSCRSGCNAKAGETTSPDFLPARPKSEGVQCIRTVIKKGESLSSRDVGDPTRRPEAPTPGDIPVLAKNIAADIRAALGHFRSAVSDFEVLSFLSRSAAACTNFLNDVNQFVEKRKAGRDEMPQFILLPPCQRSHGGLEHKSADSLCVRRRITISPSDFARWTRFFDTSPYWEDTAFCILEDDALDGPRTMLTRTAATASRHQQVFAAT
jgi:hypothetical protein